MVADRKSAPRPGAAAPGGEASGAVTPASRVHVVDVPDARVHRMADLLGLLGVVVGIAIVLLVAEYARGTTTGITSDVHGINNVLQRVLVAPVNLFSGIVTLVLPALAVIDLSIRREPRRIIEAIAAAAVGFLLTMLASYLVWEFGTPDIVRSMSVGIGGSEGVSMPFYIGGVCALLTVAGRRGTRRVLNTSWNLMWAAIVVATISGMVSITAALLTVLVGRVAGLGFRYALGSTTDRAYGDALLDGIRRAGFEPKRLVRADPTKATSLADLDEVSTAFGRARQGRVYALTTVEDHHLLVVALDADQHAAGFLTKLWSSLRLRGFDARADVSLRHSAEATALVSLAARGAGVRAARVLGMAEARDTMLIVYQRPLASRSLAELPRSEVSDDILDAIWQQVVTAHDAGISHRALSAQTILVGKENYGGVPPVWLTSWELGEVATTPVAQRIDRAQLVALSAAIVGPERAVAAAFRALGDEGVEGFAPLLQSIVLPRGTRTALRAADVRLARVREEIVERLPDADIEPEKIARFGLRTVFTIAAGVMFAYLVFASFNTEKVFGALQDANPWWLLAAAGWVLTTSIGASIAFLAFAPIKVPWGRTILTQFAASYLALAAPAGVGTAALNLRLLTRRKVPGPLAVASVALVQVSAVVVTVAGLLILTVTSGSDGTLAALPSGSVLIGVGVAAILVTVMLVVPKVRGLIVGRLRPLVRQTWPRLAQVVSQPTRLALGIGGNLLLTIAYVGAFDAVLKAFGQHLSVVDVTVLYLLGNAVGAVVPTPGGLGAVEGALTAGLVSAGLPQAVAVSVVVTFRLLTYWLRIPLGWVAMRVLRSRGEL